MKKWVFILVCVILVLQILSGCGVNNEQAINDTIAGFFAVYQNQNYSLCLDYLSQRLKTSAGEANLINDLRNARFWAVNVSLKSIGTSVINGKSATVWVDIVSGLFSQVNSIQLELVKEDGTWKIDRLGL